MSRTAIPSEESVAPARRPHLGALSSCALFHESDDRLVSLTRGGSERAFAEIMRRYQRPLHLFCLQFLGAGRAEDAVQQAFLQAFVALRDGAHREIALRPWLYRIARNCSIDLLRKQGSDHDELDPEYDGMSEADGPAEQREELARIVAAILALPEGQRRALTLRELEGRSYGEISAELGHTDSGVRQLIFRARTTLRNLGAIVFPIGSLRWRLLGQATPGAGDPHQIATAASVSAPSGTGALDTLGAIVAATVTLAAGGATTPHKHHAAVRQSAIAIAGPAAARLSPVYVLPSSAAAGAHHAKRVRVRHVTSLSAPLVVPAATPVPQPAAGPPAPDPASAAPPALQPAFPLQSPAEAAAPADTAASVTPQPQKLNAMGGATLTGATANVSPAAGGAIAPAGTGPAAPAGQSKPSGTGAQPQAGKPATAPKSPKAPAPKQPAQPKPVKPQPAKPQAPSKPVLPAKPAKTPAQAATT